MYSQKEYNKRYIIELSKELRKFGTDTEKILWELLRNRKFNGLKFRRQHPFGRYIVDFYCDEIKLIIELDGKIHEKEKQKEYDNIRDEIIEKYGVKILRLKNEEILNQPESIYEKINSYLHLTPSPLGRGLGGGLELEGIKYLELENHYNILKKDSNLYDFINGLDKNDLHEGQQLQAYIEFSNEYLKKYDLKGHLDSSFIFLNYLNTFAEQNKPRILIKENEEGTREVLYTLAEGLRQVGLCLYPFFPEKMGEMFTKLGLKNYSEELENGKLEELRNKQEIFNIKEKGEVLFKRFDV